MVHQVSGVGRGGESVIPSESFKSLTMNVCYFQAKAPLVANGLFEYRGLKNKNRKKILKTQD